MGITTVARKKRQTKLGVVKIEYDLITRAKLLASQEGKSLADYLSDVIRPVIDRDWAKNWARMAREAEQEGKEGSKP